MKKLKAVIFDVDGTLANTERDGHLVAFNKTFTNFNLNWHWSNELYGELLRVTGGKERILHYIEKHQPEFELPEGEELSSWIAKMHADKTKCYTDIVATGATPLRTGVKRLIEEIRNANIRMAIATTTSPENVTSLISSTLPEGAEKWFEVIAAGNMVKTKKPAPDVYQLALEKMELSSSECIALEDSNNGLRSAQAAGITTVITDNEYTRGENFTNAALVLDSMGEPDQPVTVLAGETYGEEYLTVDLLEKVLQNS